MNVGDWIILDRAVVEAARSKLRALRSFYTTYGESIMPAYSDQQVVAALNSCLDLTKYAALPTDVKARLCELLRFVRIKPVCFMERYGFGLRVFNDQFDGRFIGDEVHPTEANESPEDDDVGTVSGTADLGGHWLRCPAVMWKPEGERLWIVANESATRFHDGDADEFWRPGRTHAKLMTKEDAERLAATCGGIVIKRGT